MFEKRVKYTEKSPEDLKNKYVARVTGSGNVTLEYIEEDGYPNEKGYFDSFEDEEDLVGKMLKLIPSRKVLYLTEGFPLYA